MWWGRRFGWRRGWGGGFSFGGPWWFYFECPPVTPTPEEEKEMLLDYKRFLEEELRYVEERLKELENRR
ncbi:DUF5320 domain-containing protein [Thermotoga sp. SG1]|uniref:DUF5320 domain-containing protein n=1 Tax=Thermotoga sp. SG1 TaxID=126739 RepID=UPI000C782EAD|nr:DUF5320 domain-containing protein [Thermotoga sp. SG1]PLV55731.1 hypothetical protein AS006_08845 [Thermotoga sp. SG1]